MKIHRNFDLVERTARFAENIIVQVKKIGTDSVNRKIIEQLVRSAGSVGANYCEAAEAESKKDFIHKLSISKKEAKESQHWIRLLAKANPESRATMIGSWSEAGELVLIFSKSIDTVKARGQ
ncbi:MAG: four helix bundle protein [Candidatus Taylorbacteria bacterium]